jgi:hypothetical protein
MRDMRTDVLTPTSDAARGQIERLAPGAAHDQRSAARLARAALFEEALLGALKAHLAELRTVAR